MAIDDITIETEFGNIQLPTQKLYDFIIQLNQENKKRADVRQSDINDYFGDEDFNSEYYNITHFKVASYLKSMWDIINRDYNLIKVSNYDSKQLAERPPKGYDFKISVSDSEHLLMDCVLKNSLFNTNWEYVDFQKRDWKSIVISDDYRNTIDRNIVNFIANIDHYKELRLPTSRGVLITGPPGTGKTLLCETIINQVDCTKIYVTSDSVSNVGDIKQVYKVARKLAPTIVIIEDIDTLGGLDRREGGNHPLLGEFLNCLNGVGSNEGVVTLATTNYPKHLDVALIDRPGRIDLRIEFGLPDNTLRGHIFKKYLSELPTTKINYTKLIKESEGMTGAYIREVVMSAFIISQEKKSKITQEIVMEAMKCVVDMRTSLIPSSKTEDNYHS